MIIAVLRMESCIVVLIAELCWEAGEAIEERQDKKPHIVGFSVGCFVWCFPDFLHIAPSHREVHTSILLNDFSAERTSQAPAL